MGIDLEKEKMYNMALIKTGRGAMCTFDRRNNFHVTPSQK